MAASSPLRSIDAAASSPSEALSSRTWRWLQREPGLLTAVDHGDRLVEMKARLQEATASGTTTVEHLTFDHISVSLLVPFGRRTA
jgi:hypothetical protein